MLIVSDLHFGKNDEKHIEQFIEIAKSEKFNPDNLVVIPGDFNTSKTFDKFEFYLTKKFVKDLIANKIRVVCTLGNHDIELFRYSAKKHFSYLFEEYIYNQENIKVTAKGFNSITIVNNDIFVSLISVHNNPQNRRIRRKQIEWTIKELNKLQKKHDLKNHHLHLLTHVSLWKGSHDPLSKRTRLETELIKKYNFHSFIHGHNHEFISAKRSTPKLGIPIIQISAPTLAVHRAGRGSMPGFISWQNKEQFAEFISLERLKEMYDEISVKTTKIIETPDVKNIESFEDPEDKTTDFEKYSSQEDFDIDLDD